jgi:hypothetical protein
MVGSVCVGSVWLASGDQQKIGYERTDNGFTRIDDLHLAFRPRAKSSNTSIGHQYSMLLPGTSIILLQTIQESGFGGTFWVADPYKIATDLMFEDTVLRVDWALPDLLEHAILRCVRAGCFPFPWAHSAWQLQGQFFR